MTTDSKSIRTLINALKQKGFKVFEEPYKLNIVGVRKIVLNQISLMTKSMRFGKMTKVSGKANGGLQQQTLARTT